ncbi:putative set domain protein [Schistosoma mansoni]|uniref:putative set domain protein n=1 Tax=Schistosoma mansoni TaxID=6183 RepID=UPI00022DC2D7|nr:putative set domain protein [Schistosoma mansoni]|eukprot:XP_018652068.1 putative set domain protein [Schistosoma mansoni]
MSLIQQQRPQLTLVFSDMQSINNIVSEHISTDSLCYKLDPLPDFHSKEISIKRSPDPYPNEFRSLNPQHDDDLYKSVFNNVRSLDEPEANSVHSPEETQILTNVNGFWKQENIKWSSNSPKFSPPTSPSFSYQSISSDCPSDEPEHKPQPFLRSRQDSSSEEASRVDEVKEDIKSVRPTFMRHMQFRTKIRSQWKRNFNKSNIVRSSLTSAARKKALLAKAVSRKLIYSQLSKSTSVQLNHCQEPWQVGELVWARPYWPENLPWWPAIVTEKPKKYQVRGFGLKSTHDFNDVTVPKFRVCLLGIIRPLTFLTLPQTRLRLFSGREEFESFLRQTVLEAKDKVRALRQFTVQPSLQSAWHHAREAAVAAKLTKPEPTDRLALFPWATEPSFRKLDPLSEFVRKNTGKFTLSSKSRKRPYREEASEGGSFLSSSSDDSATSVASDSDIDSKGRHHRPSSYISSSTSTSSIGHRKRLKLSNDSSKNEKIGQRWIDLANSFEFEKLRFGHTTPKHHFMCSVCGEFNNNISVTTNNSHSTVNTIQPILSDVVHTTLLDSQRNCNQVSQQNLGKLDNLTHPDPHLLTLQGSSCSETPSVDHATSDSSVVDKNISEVNIKIEDGVTDNNSHQKDIQLISEPSKSELPRSGDQMIRCSVRACRRWYHPSCLRKPPFAVVVREGRSGSFTCPAHTCLACSAETPGTMPRPSPHFIRCVMCPAAYHPGDWCLPAGSKEIAPNLIICPRHALQDECKLYTSPPNIQLKLPSSGLLNMFRPTNVSWCFICSKGGRIICCESCPASFHEECLKIDEVPDKFICEDCTNGRMLRYGEIVWARELVHPRHLQTSQCHVQSENQAVTINFQPTTSPTSHSFNHILGSVLVRLFGLTGRLSHRHSRPVYLWTTRARLFPYEEGDDKRGSHSSRRKKFIYNAALKQAARGYLKRHEKFSELLGRTRRPDYYKPIKVNWPLGSVRIYRLTDPSEAPRCECKPNSEDPCGPSSNCINRELHYECLPSICPNGDACRNQRFTKRLYPPQRPFWTGDQRGWGLKTMIAIRAGEFVNEYIGDLIDEDEANRRLRFAHENNITNYYMMKLDSQRIIDAGPKGNLSRFMNHSCDPNLNTQKWTVNGDNRIGLFAVRDISVGEELTFNYNFVALGQERLNCRCGASNCVGFLGARSESSNNNNGNGQAGGNSSHYGESNNSSNALINTDISRGSSKRHTAQTNPRSNDIDKSYVKDGRDICPSKVSNHNLSTTSLVNNNKNGSINVNSPLNMNRRHETKCFRCGEKYAPVGKRSLSLFSETLNLTNSSHTNTTVVPSSSLSSSKSLSKRGLKRELEDLVASVVNHSPSKSQHGLSSPTLTNRNETQSLTFISTTNSTTTEDQTSYKSSDLILCSKHDCSKAYHLFCLDLDTPPQGQWFCPWHHCDACGRPSHIFCSICPSSFCLAHVEGSIVVLPPVLPKRNRKLSNNRSENNVDPIENGKFYALLARKPAEEEKERLNMREKDKIGMS